jgi:cyclopropane fatty-acyl-phospholipid synthase-like methyltransferase
VEAARAAFGERGRVELGSAPDFWIPEVAKGYDAVLMLDMVHFLSDRALEETLRRAHRVMRANGRLIIRANVPVEGSKSWARRFADSSRRVTREEVRLRTFGEIGKAVMEAGFRAVRTEKSGGNPESWWVTASA